MSTLGNYLLGHYHGDNGPFRTNYTNYEVTLEADIKLIEIKDRKFNLIDTPGFFNIDNKSTHDKLAEIINHCTYGIQSIIFVVKHAFGDEFCNHIRVIQDFLGEKSFDNMIIAFTYVNKAQAMNKNIMRKVFNQNTIKFLDEKFNNRWIASPHPDFSNVTDFLPNNIKEAEDFIYSFTSAYTTKMFGEKKGRERREKDAINYPAILLIGDTGKVMNRGGEENFL